jgi:small subunit ribosomal protein S9
LLQEYVDTGRRKTAVASVRMRDGNGKIDINGRSFEQYFPLEIQRTKALAPLAKANVMGKFDLIIRVKGGGIEGQAEAIRLGLARALCQLNDGLHHDFKEAGFMTRDSRKRERKKYGLAGARKRYQYSKR